MYESFPNGAYGINLSHVLQGQKVSDLGLLSEIINRFEEFDQDVAEDGVSVGGTVFREFFNRLDLALDGRGIRIPTLSDSYSGSDLVFRIHQVDHSAEIGDHEGFDQGDLILGIGILGFPNEIKFDPSFKNAAEWHLWIV